MIAISSTGNKPRDLMDIRFARCPFFVFIENGTISYKANPFREQEENVAPDVIEWLINKGVTKVITGELGQKARLALQEKKCRWC